MTTRLAGIDRGLGRTLRWVLTGALFGGTGAALFGTIYGLLESLVYGGWSQVPIVASRCAILGAFAAAILGGVGSMIELLGPAPGGVNAARVAPTFGRAGAGEYEAGLADGRNDPQRRAPTLQWKSDTSAGQNAVPPIGEKFKAPLGVVCVGILPRCAVFAEDGSSLTEPDLPRNRLRGMLGRVPRIAAGDFND